MSTKRTLALITLVIILSLMLSTAALLFAPSQTRPWKSFTQSATVNAAERLDVSTASNAFYRNVRILVNKERRKRGLRPLKISQCAMPKAKRHARYLARTQSLVHSNIRQLFQCPSTRLAGENIAAGYRTPRAVVRAWMRSKGHRANILNPRFRQLSLGIYKNTENSGYYWVNQFTGR